MRCAKQLIVQGGTIMAKPLLDDELWNVVEPLIPVKRRRFCRPGRKPLPARACLTGILFVLRSGIPWEMLPQEMGCGSGMTCWRRLRDWQASGVWSQMHRLFLTHLHGADQIDWSRALVDSSSVRAVGGATKPVPTPPIAENQAPNTTSSPTLKAFPWPSRSPAPMLTT
jgi:transposase